jgi:plastocyanin
VSSHIARAGVLLVGLAVASLVGAGCGPKASGGTPVPTTSVDLPASYRFAPADITVPAGSTVTWTNHDNFTHSVQFLSGSQTAPQVVKPGESTTFTFKDAGVVRYQCSFHPQQMQGSVTVAAP